MTEPRQTSIPPTAERAGTADRARPRRPEPDQPDTPPAAEPAAADQAIDTAGTAADPDRPAEDDGGA
jgi:hypothetical protein